MRIQKKSINIFYFTLIELLVVMAIIMVLMSMSFPALRRAKEYAYMASCLNQLKQHGIWYATYLDDNKNEWPPHYIEATEGDPGGWWWYSPGKSGIWLGFVKPPPGLLKHGKLVYEEGSSGTPAQGGMNFGTISQCPADENPTRRDYVDLDGNEYENVPISYAYNLLLYTKQIPLSRLRNPNDLVVLFDAHDLIQQQAEDPDSIDYYYNVLAERHNRGANHLFGDFHAEWRPKISSDNLIPR
ncbi:MAG TPA: type II secretion system protein [Victivallales bacterium]|nr:type II secretion system protein [Victivallales bacterium]HPO91172.1 type II secretion system protein [Victivallales bacterium]HRR06262.1 type II secretion system protein [Victivallales bacterium]HRR27751.1 type II secretion system protein [Victivallales bacterium]HRU01560.1 type II secretion system protein [Victivallales bacterium]